MYTANVIHNKSVLKNDEIRAVINGKSNADISEDDRRLNEARNLVGFTLAHVKRRFTLSYTELIFRYYWQTIITASKIIDTANDEQKLFLKYFIFAWREVYIDSLKEE